MALSCMLYALGWFWDVETFDVLNQFCYEDSKNHIVYFID